jgi:hypothetical protein
MSGTLTAQPVSPKAAPLPPLPSEDPLTAAQWKTLFAITDAIIPSIQPIAIARTKTEIPATEYEYSNAINTLKKLSPEANGDEVAKQYLEESASSHPGFKENLWRLVACYMPQSTKKELLMVLNILK